MLKYLFSMLLFASVLQAATITSQQDNYTNGQSMSFTVANMSGDRDWIGIYPVGKNNDWGNVVAWKWVSNKAKVRFSSIATGNYEARVFFHNSFKKEASDTFSVGAAVPDNATISTQKQTYTPQEAITVTVNNMQGNYKDWVAIYPKGSSNAWGNVLAWKYTKGITNGNINLGTVSAGSYEARAFFNNSYTLKASHSFVVRGNQQNASITTQKASYTAGESITVTVNNMQGNYKDWVAIYPKGSSNAWGNVLAWKYTKGITNGNINLGSIPVGNYEARAFFNNSYNLKASHSFSVKSAGGGGNANAKIFIIGDSTVHNTSAGEMGWGSKLGTYMKSPNNVFNRARSGASSKTYKNHSNGHHDWTYTKNMMRNADISNGAYLLIQFGHNDEKGGSLHTEPGRNNSYYNHLKAYVNEARDLGFTPVLITPVSRQYKGSRTHGQYPQTMKYLAADENVLLLDLEYKSYLEFKKYASDGAIQAVFSYDDGTHFNPTGARIVAGWVKELICNAGNQSLCSQF